MNAKNIKIVFLSGTPAINKISELGILFNLLRGPINYYKLNIKGYKNLIIKQLKTIKEINRIQRRNVIRFCFVST